MDLDHPFGSEPLTDDEEIVVGQIVDEDGAEIEIRPELLDVSDNGQEADQIASDRETIAEQAYDALRAARDSGPEAAEDLRDRMLAEIFATTQLQNEMLDQFSEMGTKGMIRMLFKRKH